MASLNRLPEISYEHADVPAIEDHFDRATESWKQPFKGPLWSVVAHARKNGLTGEGRTVAIIDSGFDLSIKKLNEATLGGCVQESQPGGSLDHGTLVALLINEIAPEATLDLYEVSVAGRPSAALIKKALQKIEGSDADIVNMSLGHSSETDGGGICDCTLAASVAQLTRTNKLVVAACGNEVGPLKCPAEQQSVLSVGYASERREIEWDGEVPVRETAIADRPGFDQSMLADMVVRQPPDVAGSSFAAPMICGLAALSPAITHLAEWRDVLSAATNASTATALDDPKLQQMFPWDEPINALSELPAFEDSPLLRWMTQWIYINHAHYLMTQNYMEALKQAHIGVRIAPWSDNAWSMVAGINKHLADRLDNSSQDQRAEAIERYKNAVKAYDHALVIREKHKLYSYWRVYCLRRLAELQA